MPALPPFWLLAETHAAELLAHARRLAGDDAEDIVQESLLRALRAYPRLTHGEHLRAWLYRITTNVAHDHHGRPSQGRELLVGAVPDQPSENGDPGASHDFDSLLADLPSPARTALTLRFVDDLDYRDIATRLDCSEPAARQRVSKAVSTLRRSLT